MTASDSIVFKPGALLGARIRLDQQLGQGGMGAIWKGHDLQRGHAVAVKQLRLSAYDAPAPHVAQFEREYHTLSQLSHPCIVQVYDYGVENGWAYYTMERLEGRDLGRRGVLPWHEACAVLRDVASALAMLHSRRLLHRDISSRNVFCTDGGRAKLIDFGAMTPMGVTRQIVGTPPFTPPEALQSQPLDGRADLYALGALAYRTLTGAYAYPARSFQELARRFHTPCVSARERTRELPDALDALVMQLLQHDPAARPRTAAEVMERLSGIAGLPLAERAEVSRSYLVTPMLVGREAALERARQVLSSARDGQGVTLLIEGARGAGRSRLLDACVLEAKLLGAVVLRADATESGLASYAVARSLVGQLLSAVPALSEQSSLEPPAVVRSLLGGAREKPGPKQHESIRFDRRQVLSNLHDWLLTVAQRHHIAIAVDDVDRIDEPSAALLGSLADGTRGCRLSLLVTSETGAGSTAALTLLRDNAIKLVLPALELAQTEALLRSVFGDVPHVALLSNCIHALAAGSPSWTMLLAEQLVERAQARYEAGSWILPDALHADALPESVTAAQRARLAALSADARELAEAFALLDPPGLTAEHFPALTAHADSGRTYRALETLLAGGILAGSGEHYRFSPHELRGLLVQELSEERGRELHARIARVIGGTDLRAKLPYHLLHGGQERAAIDALLAGYEQFAVYAADDIGLLELALHAAPRLHVPRRAQLELQLMCLNRAALLGDRDTFLRSSGSLLERVVADSGLGDFYALAADLPLGERAAAARQLAQQRYAATPEAARGFRVEETPTAITRIYSAFMMMGSQSIDLPLLEQLPALDPLFEQWPQLEFVQAHVEICRSRASGHHARAIEKSRWVVDFVDRQPSPSTPMAHARLAQLSALGSFAATSGQAEVNDYVAELEKVPSFRVEAWRLRTVYELMRGNMSAANDCQRRAELLHLQVTGGQRPSGVTPRLELLAYMHADDLMGVKRARDALCLLAQRYPGWESTYAVARSQYRRLQGDAEGALDVLRPALESTVAGRHVDWWLVAHTHVQVLTELGRLDEAIERGLHYVETWTQGGFHIVDYGLRQVTAEALLRAGQCEAARAMIDTYIELHTSAGTRGLRLGLAYETRARVAIAENDDAAVRRFAQRCAHEYKGGRHLGLLNRYTRLLRDADARGIALGVATRTSDGAVQTWQSMPPSRISDEEIAQAGLRELLQGYGADCGYLFVLRNGCLHGLVASETSETDAEGLSDMLEASLRGETSSDAVATTEAKSASPLRWRDGSGREFQPVLLSARYEGRFVAVGMAALHGAVCHEPPQALIESLSCRLIGGAAAEPLILS